MSPYATHFVAYKKIPMSGKALKAMDLMQKLSTAMEARSFWSRFTHHHLCVAATIPSSAFVGVWTCTVGNVSTFNNQ